jgi:AcrR family transcriptional regulator
MKALSSTSATLNPGVRERILLAARAEFAAHGSRAASVRSIGERAGVTAAMINYYFGSKGALYDMVVEQAQAHLYAHIAEATKGDRKQLAARLAEAYFDFLSEEREFQRLILREVLDGGQGVPAFVHKYVAPLRALFEDEFGGDDDTFQTAVSLFGAVAGYFLYEPVLTELLGSDATAADNLARRRRHVAELATRLSEGNR